jgi:hypothetical protein
MFNCVDGWGYEIVRGVGSTCFPGCVAGAQGGVVCLRPEVHRVVGIEGVACGYLDGGREKVAIVGGETPGDVWQGSGVARW